VSEKVLVPDGLIERPIRLGAWLVALCGLIMFGSLWAVAPAGSTAKAYGIVAGVSAFGAALRLAPDTWFTGRLRLVFPLLVLAELAALSLVAPAAAQPYLPLIVLAFIYIGLSHRPGTTAWMLTPAAVAWLLGNAVHTSGLSAALAIRLPISAFVWLLVGELLARYVSQVRQDTGRLEGQVSTDALTGLYNRRVLAELLATSQPGDALVMLDVDHFRIINETRGHAGGDAVLRSLGTVLRACVRAQDRAVRYGGEEVLLMLPAVGGTMGIDALLSRVRDAWLLEDPEVTFSAGGVVLARGEDADAALQRADALLYEAKQAGRNRWHLADGTTVSAVLPVPRAPEQRSPISAPARRR
jgi:diguanylate cyclase (GGDEF)-like protein